jgi:hypothetical protein
VPPEATQVPLQQSPSQQLPPQQLWLPLQQSPPHSGVLQAGGVVPPEPPPVPPPAHASSAQSSTQLGSQVSQEQLPIVHVVVSVVSSTQTVSVTLPQDAEVDVLLHWASARPASTNTKTTTIATSSCFTEHLPARRSKA